MVVHTRARTRSLALAASYDRQLISLYKEHLGKLAHSNILVQLCPGNVPILSAPPRYLAEGFVAESFKEIAEKVKKFEELALSMFPRSYVQDFMSLRPDLIQTHLDKNFS